MKRFTIAASLLLLVAVAISIARTEPRKDNVSEFMRVKLKHSQKVLEGLSTEDYDLIGKSAQEMSLLSHAAQWQVLQTPEYSRRSAEFRRATEKLKEKADKKNLDGATLAFVDLTIKCVECHKYMRKVQTARLDEFPLRDNSAQASLSGSSAPVEVLLHMLPTN